MYPTTTQSKVKSAKVVLPTMLTLWAEGNCGQNHFCKLWYPSQKAFSSWWFHRPLFREDSSKRNLSSAMSGELKFSLFRSYIISMRSRGLGQREPEHYRKKQYSAIPHVSRISPGAENTVRDTNTSSKSLHTLFGSIGGNTGNHATLNSYGVIHVGWHICQPSSSIQDPGNWLKIPVT